MDTVCSIKRRCIVVTNMEVSEMKNMLSGLPLETVLVAGIYITMLSTDEILRKCEKWSFTFDIKIKRKV